jgi:hypothetical protein
MLTLSAEGRRLLSIADDITSRTGLYADLTTSGAIQIDGPGEIIFINDDPEAAGRNFDSPDRRFAAYFVSVEGLSNGDWNETRPRVDLDITEASDEQVIIDTVVAMLVAHNIASDSQLA